MNKIKVLIVEDDVITAVHIQTQLKLLGYDVPAIIASGKEAIAMANKLRPDIILMDTVLKGEMDGIEAAKSIYVMYHIPIVFLTAFSDPDTIDRVKTSLPYGYITKPYDRNGLRLSLELALYKFKMDSESAFEEEAKKLRAHEITLLKDEFLKM